MFILQGFKFLHLNQDSGADYIPQQLDISKLTKDIAHIAKNVAVNSKVPAENLQSACGSQ